MTDDVEPTVDVFSDTSGITQEEQAQTVEEIVSAEVSAVADTEEQVSNETTSEQSVEVMPEIIADAPAEKPKRGAKKIIKLIALLLVLVLILTSAGIMAYKYYTDWSDINAAVSDYVDAVYLGEYENAEDMIPESFLEGETDKEYYDLILENYDPKELAEQRSYDLDKYFGTDIVIKVEVTEFDYIISNTQLIYSDIFRLNYGSEFEFDRLYRTEFEVTVVGSDAEKTFSHYLYAMEYDGQWYLFDMRYSYFAFVDVYVDYLEIDALFEDDEAVYF